MKKVTLEDLDSTQLELLDTYIIEQDLYKEHQEAASLIASGLCGALRLHLADFLALARHRRSWYASPKSRAIADKNLDEQAWLEARRTGVTATEVARLAKKQPAERAKILMEKLTGERSFQGNKYTNWGLERESVICADVTFAYGLEGSDVLYHAVDNKRHLATPDAVLIQPGLTLIAEIKTSKYGLDPFGEHFSKSGYMDQMQWQMYVMGPECVKCLFVWEIHDDNWVPGVDNVERPTPTYRGSEWIYRDQERIDYLICVADDFLAEMDWSA